MSRTFPSLSILTVTASAIATVHILALQNYWYWYFPLLDIPMHFFGGFLIGGSTVFFLDIMGGRFLKEPVRAAFLGALAVGIGWEVFEGLLGIATDGPFWYYLFDTVKDLIIDSLGGMFAGVLFGKLISRSGIGGPAL